MSIHDDLKNNPIASKQYREHVRASAVRAILFDKDGTLFDFRRSWMPIINAVTMELAGGDAVRAEALGSAAGYERATDRFVPDGPIAAGSADDIVEAWSGLLPAYTRAAVRAILDRYSAEDGPRSASPVCDLAALFAVLRGAGLTLGLATSDSGAGARLTLARFGIEKHFAWVNGYDSGNGAKPDPRIVHRFARVAGVRAAETAVVGDTLHDMRMGRDAGVAIVIGVMTGAVDRETLARDADLVLESIAALPRVLGLEPGTLTRE